MGSGMMTFSSLADAIAHGFSVYDAHAYAAGTDLRVMHREAGGFAFAIVVEARHFSAALCIECSAALANQLRDRCDECRLTEALAIAQASRTASYPRVRFRGEGAA